MSRIPYQIRLTGLDAPKGAISMASLAELCHAVVEGARQALRLQVEGLSTRSGPVPDWIRAATDFKVDGLHPGSTVLTLNVPVLSETPLFGGDGAPPDDIRPDETALSVFGQAVADLEARSRDSDRIDHGLLSTFSRFNKLGSGVRVEFVPADAWRRAERFVVDQDIIRMAAALQADTPADRAVVLTGRLDAIAHGSSRFTLVADNGARIKGTLAGSDTSDRLRELWGRYVTVQGRARHTAAGRVRFIEASVLRAFAEGDQSIAALAATPYLPLIEAAMSTQSNAAASLRGAWPGDESIEELLDALGEGE